MAKEIQRVFGVKVLSMDFKELNFLYQKADRDEAQEHADRWIRLAEKVIEPDRKTIDQCAAMYLAEKALMKKHGAQAITVNCLGGFYGGHITAYPCLGFYQLNNDGLVGGCESDLISALTMVVGTALSGRPGYISDPVIDTAKNQIIYAHCVAPSKMFGPKGPTNPYHVRSHSEDRKGAVVRSLMPLGFLTTTIEIHPSYKKILFHQGKAVDNVDDDKACRSKLAVEVKGDIEKLMNEWDQWGWHRVTFYGDLKEPIRQLADAVKYRFVEEA
jgi:L-fucose isomerase-like protein